MLTLVLCPSKKLLPCLEERPTWPETTILKLIFTTWECTKSRNTNRMSPDSLYAHAWEAVYSNRCLKMPWLWAPLHAFELPRWKKKKKKTVCELGNISRQALRVRFAKHFISGIHLRSSSPSSFSCRARNIAGISQSHVSRHFLNGALLVGRRQICLDREMLQSYSWVWKTSMEDCHNRDQSSWELHLYSSWNGQCHDRWAWS